LRPGENTITITATNAGPGTNPAGLIAAFELKYKDGSKDLIYTDKSWSTSLEEKTDWKPAIVLGQSAMGPWGLSPTTPAPELYPNYDDTTVVLKQMGISEDFTSTGPVRYGHRSTRQQEIYFVSNKTADNIQADCTFRVDKSNQQLWNPVTGRLS
jgi:alpha-L-rhamnosidase